MWILNIKPILREHSLWIWALHVKRIINKNKSSHNRQNSTVNLTCMCYTRGRTVLCCVEDVLWRSKTAVLDAELSWVSINICCSIFLSMQMSCYKSPPPINVPSLQWSWPVNSPSGLQRTLTPRGTSVMYTAVIVWGAYKWKECWHFLMMK